MSLAKKISIGVFWNFLEHLGRRGVGVAVTLLLAYFLTPVDFGLVAMMAIFLTLGSTLMDSGFKQALIRIKDVKDVKEVDYSTAFYANIILGLLSYLLLFLSAPFISSFYDEPELVTLIRVSSLLIILNSFQIVHTAILNRTLNFKLQLKISIPTSILSGSVAIILAGLGYGVWALISQMLTYAFFSSVLFWIYQPWRPKFHFSRKSLVRMYDFGYKIFLTGILDIVFKNLYIVIIAKMFSASVAGLYFFAEKIKDLIVNQVVTSIQTVTYPALASIQDDNIRLKAGYRKVISVMTFVLTPILLFLAALAEPLFVVFLPDRWLQAVPYLQLMCLAVVMSPLNSINSNILKVKGRSDLLLFLEIIKKIMATVVLVVSVQYGIIGILVGQIINSILIFIPNSYYSNELIGYSAIEQILDFLPSFIIASIAASLVATGVYFFNYPGWVEILIFGFAGAVFYLGIACLLKSTVLNPISIFIKENFPGKLNKYLRC